jgi:very-short-patch-repair endonuclease
MQHQSTSSAQRNARLLRAAMTNSERKLWYALRGEQLGVKFRRQHPFGRYIADFACLEPKLVVELDGSQHAANEAYDDARDRFFRANGFAVLRFASNEPLVNLEGVLTVIQAHVQRAVRAPSPTLPHRGGSRSKDRSSP